MSSKHIVEEKKVYTWNISDNTENSIATNIQNCWEYLCSSKKILATTGLVLDTSAYKNNGDVESDMISMLL